MARFGSKILAFMVCLPVLQPPSFAVNAQQATPNSLEVPLVPPAPAPVPNQDTPQLLVGQPASVPLNTPEVPYTARPRPTNLEDALGLDAVPDILKVTPNTPPRVSNAPIAPRPSRPPTPQEIAREIAPNFNVATEYNRLAQCYGTADFLSALLRVRANRPGATPQIRAMADQISNLKGQMQPFVLAASTVRTEARFRADYDRVARNISNQVTRSKNPDAVVQTNLRVLDGCNREIRRWRGGR